MGLSCRLRESSQVQGACAWSCQPSTLGKVGQIKSECWEVGRREARAGWGPIPLAVMSQRLMCSGWVTPKDRTHTACVETGCFRVGRGENCLPKLLLNGGCCTGRGGVGQAPRRTYDPFSSPPVKSHTCSGHLQACFFLEACPVLE